MQNNLGESIKEILLQLMHILCGYEESGLIMHLNIINSWDTRLGRDENKGEEKFFKEIGNESFVTKFQLL